MTNIIFYCGLSELAWNRHPVAPGPLACVSPVYGKTEHTRCKNSVRVPEGTQVIQDSGAFSDGPRHRLTFAGALRRQVLHAAQYHYAHQITHVASYDTLIDEKWYEGQRFKVRWSEADAQRAVTETIASARWLSEHRHVVWPDVGLILSAQGVTPDQYLDCVRQIVPMLQANDMLGLGGWCITGKMPKKMLPPFIATLERVLPLIAQAGIHRVHVWGVIHPASLAFAARLCDQYSIALSTDSAGPALNPVRGQWGYGHWRDNAYQTQPVETRGLERARHVALTRAWLEHFEPEKYITRRHLKWLADYNAPYQLELPF